MSSDTTPQEAAADPFDLSALDASPDGSWLDVTHPITGEPIPGMRILVASFDAEQASAHKRKVQKKNLRRTRQGDDDVDPEEIERNALELLAAVTLGWEGLSLGAGVPLAFNPHNAAVVYQRFPWLRRQVDRHAASIGNYLGNSAGRSSTSQHTPSGSESAPPVAN